jgi:two-component system, sensor histidine kinase
LRRGRRLRPALVERILRNLVSNAVRYTERGRIVVGCRRRGPGIAMQVCDTGAGIPGHQQALVFQEYYQLGNPERDRAKGLGLGLAIVRRLADLLGCPLTLRSKPGKGSCFEVVVPLAAERAGVQEPSPDEPKGGPAARFVVVIDDEQAIRDATSSLLRAGGIVWSPPAPATRRSSACLLHRFGPTSSSAITACAARKAASR